MASATSTQRPAAWVTSVSSEHLKNFFAPLYRIVFQGWPKEEAIEELMHGGYGYLGEVRVGVTVMHVGNITLPLIPSHRGRGED